MPGFSRELLDHYSLLGNKVASNFLVEFSPSVGGLDLHGATVFVILDAGHVPLALKRIDDSACGALIQEHFFSQGLKPHCPFLGQRFDRVALGDRDVVAADPVSVSELVDTDELIERLMQLLGILGQLIILGLRHNRHKSVVSCNNNRRNGGPSTQLSQGRATIECMRFTVYSKMRIFDFPYVDAAMTDPIKVLFVCVANSARSQLAEALLRHTDPRFVAFSAGSQPSRVDPRTVAALEDADVDASGLRSKSIEEFRGKMFDYVITLCDKSAQECQAMPGAVEVISWDFPDPVTSDDPGAFRHALHDIHERIKLFVLVKTKHLEDV